VHTLECVERFCPNPRKVTAYVGFDPLKIVPGASPDWLDQQTGFTAAAILFGGSRPDAIPKDRT